MDAGSLPSFAELLPRLAEPLGIAGLFALAIWAAAQLIRAGIQAHTEIELRRIELQRLMAEALRAGAEAQGEQAAAINDLRQQVGGLTIATQRVLQLLEMGR